MTYHPSIWSQAPEGATHWGFNTGVAPSWLKSPDGKTAYLWVFSKFGETLFDFECFEEIHERPAAYKTPEQLIADYRKEHGAAIEADADSFLKGLVENHEEPSTLDYLLDDALFHLVLIEKYLAAERARIEGEVK